MRFVRSFAARPALLGVLSLLSLVASHPVRAGWVAYDDSLVADLTGRLSARQACFKSFAPGSPPALAQGKSLPNASADARQGPTGVLVPTFLACTSDAVAAGAEPGSLQDYLAGEDLPSVTEGFKAQTVVPQFVLALLSDLDSALSSAKEQAEADPILTASMRGADNYLLTALVANDRSMRN